MTIDKIIKNVAADLAKMYHKPNGIALAFPRLRDGKIRISEQESKILFSKYLFENNITFSIEAPTSGTYGAQQKSARPDMLIYKNSDAQDTEWMIELKRGPHEKGIRNDFKKMIKEGQNCLWFLTLENSSEIAKLPERMNKILKEEIAQHKGVHTWKIAMIVLKTGILYFKEILLIGDTFESINNIEAFSKGKVFEVEEKDDITDSQLQSFPKAGKSMIYAKKINAKTFLHFSWGKGSCYLRDYSSNDTIEPKPEKGRSISEVRALIDREIEFKKNDPKLNDVKYWHKKTIELNRKFI
jgi:hypothetical protein